MSLIISVIRRKQNCEILFQSELQQYFEAIEV
jgi:hypothetical protein